MSSKIQHDPEFGPIHQKGTSGWSVVFRVVVWIGLVMVLIALLLPAWRGPAGPAVWRAMCTNNLKQIALALHNYEEAHRMLPPAHTTDADGRPLHSWRTLILPFMEEQSLYQTIDLSKPWNDPANARALAAMPSAFRCPAAKGTSPTTNYLAIVGPHFALLPTRGRRMGEFLDGISNTLLVIEAPADFSVPWMAPLDADESLVLNIGPASKLNHPGGVNAALGDGSVRFLKAGIPSETRKALMTISGQEVIPVDSW